MDRRKFIQNSLTAAVAPVFLSGLPFRSFGASVMPTCSINNRKLVIVYLNGANDIVNTMVPMQHFNHYQSIRNEIHIPANHLITLDNSLVGTNQELGLNPGLQSFKDLYDSDLLAIVQRAGYPIPNRSHFASLDNMLKGIDGNIPNTTETEGWIGRFLKDRYPTYKGIPFGNELDPLGILVGSTTDTGFHSNEAHSMEINLSGQDPAGFYSIISSLSGEPITSFPNSEHGQMLQYLTLIEKSTQVYSERISQVFAAGANTKTYPNTTLGNQLKTIARFISGGSNTKVFMAQKGGWDTHVLQANTGATHTGNHTNLLQDLSDCLKIFQEDLQAFGKSEDVVTVVFSEFGRTLPENVSGGTDHGTLNSMFLMGDAVASGVYGQNLSLDPLDSSGNAADVTKQLEHDYRSVFATLLQDWLGADDSQVISTFQHKPDVLQNKIPIIQGVATADPTCYYEPILPLSMTLDVKVFLEGYFDKSTGEMRTDLNDLSLVPLNQPFFHPAFSYYGNEEVSAIPADVVDWILLEVRNPLNLVVQRKAIFIRKDGMLVETDGSTNIIIDDIHPDPYHIALMHRSHIAIISKQLVQPHTGTHVSIDLSQMVAAAQGVKQLKGYQGKFMMISGDIDQNGVVNSADYSYWRRLNNSTTYDPSDLNADGKTNIEDYFLWKENRGRIGNPFVHQNLSK